MKLQTRLIVAPVFAFACAVGIALSGCASLNIPSQTAIDQKADPILKRLSDKLKESESFSYSGDREIDAPLSLDGKAKERATVHGTVRHPGQFQGTVSDAVSTRTITCDGSTLTLQDTNGNVYANVKAKSTLDGTLDALKKEWGVKPPMAAFLRSDPYKAMTSVGGNWVTIGSETVAGASCDHLRLTIDDGIADLWVARADGLPKQLTITYTCIEGSPKIQVRNLKWNLKPKISAGQFTPKLTAGATKVEMIPAN